MKKRRPYTTYKPSGIEWLGEIPEHWEVRRLKHAVAELVAGGTPDTNNDANWSQDESEVAWVAIGDLTRESTVVYAEKRVTQLGIREKRLRILPPGTLLYSIYASLGKVAVLGIPAVTNQAILGIIPKKDRINGEYLRRWLEYMERHVAQLSSSNTQDNLNAEKVRNVPVYLPPIPEQRAIAAFLDRETARIDALIEKIKKSIDLLQEYRTALITAAVTGKIDVREEVSA